MNANVTVTVQRIPKEAVIQSGSVRLDVSPETFISEENGRERLTHLLKARVDAKDLSFFLHFHEFHLGFNRVNCFRKSSLVLFSFSILVFSLTFLRKLEINRTEISQDPLIFGVAQGIF